MDGITEKITGFVPAPLVPLFVIFALAFLIGFEREERKGHAGYAFGGVRTFPLIGFCGYMMASFSSHRAIAIALGFVGLSSLLWLSYQKKVSSSEEAGMTTEVSALFTYLLGAVVAEGAYWEATALAVAALLLLELKTTLERLARRIPPVEILTFTRFLLMTAVILPLVPNREFSAFALNPFRIWLAVVAISGISYLAYVANLFLGASRGVLASAALGGLYSSTVTTVALARQSRDSEVPESLAGAVLLASGLMYFRLLALLFIFNSGLGASLLYPFLALGAIGTAGGWAWSMRGKKSPASRRNLEKRNPLELQSAFFFAFLFVVMAVLTKLVLEHAGSTGLFSLSFLTGLTDIDPFVMSLSQSAGTTTPILVAAKGVVIASASNDLLKGTYAVLAGHGAFRRQAFALLATLAAATALSLLFLP